MDVMKSPETSKTLENQAKVSFIVEVFKILIVRFLSEDNKIDF